MVNWTHRSFVRRCLRTRLTPIRRHAQRVCGEQARKFSFLAQRDRRGRMQAGNNQLKAEGDEREHPPKATRVGSLRVRGCVGAPASAQMPSAFHCCDSVSLTRHKAS